MAPDELMLYKRASLLAFYKLPEAAGPLLRTNFPIAMNHTPRMLPRFLEHSPWKWWLLMAFIGSFALGIRLYYVTHAVVFQPANLPNAHGDAVEYYNYARNLFKYGIFSRDPLGALPPVSDSFRDPGYPVFLAAWMMVFPQWDSWYAAVLFAQAALGAWTVLLWLQIGRRCMPPGWLAAAGMIMAIWPHSVAMSSDIMSETLYGFLVALALAVFGIAERRNSVAWGVISGFCFCLAALTNAVLIPFAVLITLYKLSRHQMRIRVATAVIASTLAILSPWIIRNAILHSDRQSSSDRIQMNFVQGSWPLYHSAVKASQILKDPRATTVANQINNEIYAIEANHLAGLSMMHQRIARDPGSYLLWYLQKPALLWDWSLRIGAGDIYFHVTYHSPFDVSPAWEAAAAVCHACNGLMMLFALTGCLLALSTKLSPNDLAASALVLLSVTTIYTVLQAEPRYSIPYRGAEIILAVFGLNLIVRKMWEIRNRSNAGVRSGF